MKTLLLAVTLFTMSTSAFSMGEDQVGHKDGADCGERGAKVTQTTSAAQEVNTSSAVDAE